MKDFPIPDKYKNKSNRELPQASPSVVPASPIGNETIPPVMETPSGKLTEDETSFILRTTLLPEHHRDPNVLRFISAYLRCRDPRQAADEAGLDKRAGPNLRARPDIHKAITSLSEKSVQKYGFDASEIIERVKEISSLDPLDFENPDGSYKALRDMRPEARRAIKRIKVKNTYGIDPNGMKMVSGEIIDIELWDKLKSHELLGREKAVFKETKKIEHDITSNMASLLLESKERAEKRFNELQDVTPTLEITGKTDAPE